MKTINDGGPAFPRPAVFTAVHGLASVELDGMTMRDYFAAKAMRRQPLFPKNFWQLIRWAIGMSYDHSTFSHAAEARRAYEQADAMLKAREAR